MKKINNYLNVQNKLAADSKPIGVIKEIDRSFLKLMSDNKIVPKPLLICSGGTSSRCVAENHWTLDLREKYKNIRFNSSNNEIEIGGGVNMGMLINELSKFKRTFPVGLSTSTGLGYILSGGVSPISRSKGLAIDQIKKISGVFGNGEQFCLDKPRIHSTANEKKLWRALCGSSAFLAIITGLTLKTYERTILMVYEGEITIKELDESIMSAELWPKEICLNWIWRDKINAYIVVSIDELKQQDFFIDIIKRLSFFSKLKLTISNNFNDVPIFGLTKTVKESQTRTHSEVVGLLGPAWGEYAKENLEKIERLLKKRPHEGCYVAAQQLGEVSSQVNKSESSFIHRNSVWKPWINGEWNAGELKMREKSLSWVEEVWQNLESTCPGVHLAQLHPHLSWHQKELKKAFNGFLPELQNLKLKYDPLRILPPL